MILLKITEEEKPILLEALHYFGGEIETQMETKGEDEDLEPYVRKLSVIDQIIDVLQLTNKKSVC